MMNIFEAAWWARGPIGYLYLFTWCSIVIFVIVNVFLVIVQDAYENITLSTRALPQDSREDSLRGEPFATGSDGTTNPESSVTAEGVQEAHDGEHKGGSSSRAQGVDSLGNA